jgi:hypothetical protein
MNLQPKHLTVPTCLLISVACWWQSRAEPASRQGAIIERWETRGNGLSIRISAHEEKGVLLPGTFYVFESRSAGSSDWQHVMTFRHDDRPAIPQDHVHFVGSHAAYVFMGWTFAITRDGGASWKVWDATKDLASWQCCNYGLIGQVQIASDGTGTMSLRPIPERSGEVPALRTIDFGEHWGT